MEKLSVVIITFNEEEHLNKCLDSISGIADEILVLDSFSTDRTAEICRAAGVTFCEHTFDGYITQKNRAIDLAQHDLILALDGDEALSHQAAQDIERIKQDRQAVAYSFVRRNNYCGKWMRFTSMYPDRKVRLFDKRKAQWGGYDPHDKIEVDAGSPLVNMQSEILHWVYNDHAEHQAKTESFSTLAAQAYFENGRKTSFFAKYFHASWRFLYEYILRLGLLEGKRGLQFSVLSARYVYLKYAKLEKLYAS